MISKHDAAFSEPIYAPERLCLWAAGVSPRVITFLPSEKHLYVSVGAGVLLTAIMAAFSGYFCFNLVLREAGETWAPAEKVAPLAAFWALLIGNLDRSIVCNTTPWSAPGNSFGKAVLLVCRVALAVLISFIVSVPLELQLFRQTVNSKAESIQRSAERKQFEEEQKNAKTDSDNAEAEFGAKIGSIQAEIKALSETSPTDERATSEFSERTKTLTDQIATCDASLKNRAVRLEQLDSELRPLGKGPRYDRLKKDWDDAKAAQKKDEDSRSLFFAELSNLQKKRDDANEDLANRRKNRLKELRNEFTALKNAYNSRLQKPPTTPASTGQHAIAVQSSPTFGLLEQINALEKIDKFPIVCTKWLVRALVILIEIIPLFLKLTSRVKLYDELSKQISQANMELCLDTVQLQKQATSEAFKVANELRVQTVKDNRNTIVDAAKGMIQGEVDKWKSADAPRARDFWHNFRVITDQLFPGRIADYGKGSEAHREGDPPKSILAALAPTSTLVFAGLIIAPGIFVHAKGGGTSTTQHPEIWIAGIGIAVGCMFDYMKTAGNNVQRYRSAHDIHPADAAQKEQSGRSSLGRFIWTGLLILFLIAGSWFAPRAVPVQGAEGSGEKSLNANSSSAGKSGGFGVLDSNQLLALVLASVVAMLAQISKQEDP